MKKSKQEEGQSISGRGASNFRQGCQTGSLPGGGDISKLRTSGQGEENHVKFWGRGIGRGANENKSCKMEMTLGREVREVDRTRPCRALLEFYSQGYKEWVWVSSNPDGKPWQSFKQGSPTCWYVLWGEQLCALWSTGGDKDDSRKTPHEASAAVGARGEGLRLGWWWRRW